MDVLPQVDNRENDPVMFIVDETGAGTHKTVEAAIADAQKHPNRRTMITIKPYITIENFELPDDPSGGL